MKEYEVKCPRCEGSVGIVKETHAYLGIYSERHQCACGIIYDVTYGADRVTITEKQSVA